MHAGRRATLCASQRLRLGAAILQNCADVGIIVGQVECGFAFLLLDAQVGPGLEKRLGRFRVAKVDRRRV